MEIYIIIYQIMHMKLKVSTNKISTYNERRDIIGVFPDDDIRDTFNNLNESIPFNLNLIKLLFSHDIKLKS